MQKLEIFQSLWAMEMRHPDKPERSHEENFAMIAAAGYDGVCLDPGIADLDDYEPTRPLFEKHGLASMFNAFPHTPDELQPLLDAAATYNARQVNVIGEVMPIDYREAVPVIERWMGEAAAMNMPLLVETHRNSTLNDLYYTLQVMDAIPDLRLCADLSHFVVDREFEAPLSKQNAAYIKRVLERSDCFQGRVANREQVQIQIDFPQHQEWVEIFKGWWKEGMRLWRQRNADDATLIFLCELGPPSYAITDAGGYELSDRWQEALTIKAWVEDMWRELDEELPASR
jgi:hypothetical protein